MAWVTISTIVAILPPVFENLSVIFLKQNNTEGAGTWPNPFPLIFKHYNTFGLTCKEIYLTDRYFNSLPKFSK